MSFLQSPGPCVDSQGNTTDWLCAFVQKQTGNDWLARASDWLIAKPLALLGLLIAAVVIRWLLHRLIDRLAKRAALGMPSPLMRWSRENEHDRVTGAGRRVQRSEAMGSLLKSIVSIVVWSVAAITAIAELGYPVGPLIASAGVVGVALGFGAQSLVKDFLSGIFMIFEDQYGVGDVVDLGEAVGTVEAVGLRVTRIRDIDGTVWYVRNGEILRVGNSSQNWARTVLDVSVAYHEDLRRVREVLQEVADGMWQDEDYQGLIVEKPEVWGYRSSAPTAA